MLPAFANAAFSNILGLFRNGRHGVFCKPHCDNDLHC